MRKRKKSGLISSWERELSEMASKRRGVPHQPLNPGAGFSIALYRDATYGSHLGAPSLIKIHFP